MYTLPLRTLRLPALALLVMVTGTGVSAEKDAGITVTIRQATARGPGGEAGTVRLQDSRYGLLIVPDLHGLSPGPHAAHVHEHPSCAPGGTTHEASDTYTDEPQYPPPPQTGPPEGEGIPAGAAGGHYDPGRIDEHKGEWHHHGPYADGHLGDLPNLIVEQDGTARIPVLAPRLSLDDVRGGLGHALVIEAGVDRYKPYADNHDAADDAPVYCGVVR